MSALVAAVVVIALVRWLIGMRVEVASLRRLPLGPGGVIRGAESITRPSASSSRTSSVSSSAVIADALASISFQVWVVIAFVSSSSRGLPW